MEQGKRSFFEKLRAGLGRTRESVFAGLFHADERVNEAFFEELGGGHDPRRHGHGDGRKAP